MPNTNSASGRLATQQNIRMPSDIRQQIRELAISERRSFGSQVVVLLEKALEQEKAEAASTAPAN